MRVMELVAAIKPGWVLPLGFTANGSKPELGLDQGFADE